MSDRSNDEFFARGTAEGWCCDEQEQQNSIIHLELMELTPLLYQRRLYWQSLHAFLLGSDFVLRLTLCRTIF